MNYKAILQYDGTRYRGWQVQGNTDNTIQGKIETLLTRMAGEPVEVNGSGRTDAGVHAAGQVISFRCQTDRTPEDICAYMNQYLPEDICVLSVEEAAPRFHAGSMQFVRLMCTGSGMPRSDQSLSGNM